MFIDKAAVVPAQNDIRPGTYMVFSRDIKTHNYIIIRKEMELYAAYNSDNNMNRKKALATILACGLISALALSGTMAYLTDNESHTNTVQVSGNVRLDLVEENWDETDSDNNGVPDAAQKTVPNQQIPKDPKVINTGENPMFVFLRMTVPVKDVTKVTDNGKLVTKANSENPLTAASGNNGPIFHEPQELFFFKRSSDAVKDHVNHFYTPNAGDQPGWIRLEAQESNLETKADGTYTAPNANKVGQGVYVFGYNTTLAPGAPTTQLYDLIQIKNIIENEVASDQIQNIKIEAFGIQADNIMTAAGTVMPTTGYRTVAELNEIYNIFVNQNGKVDTTKETESTNNNGDFIWNTYQDTEHGQTQKEAEISNERNLKNTDKRVSTTISEAHVTKPDMMVGETTQFAYTVTSLRDGATNTPHYESSNPEVASVGETTGLITAKKAGDAMITVTVDGVKKPVEVHVFNDSRDQVPDTTVDANNANNDPQGTTQP